MQKLNVKFDKLKYIHHISDIQIRNLKRHTEYEEVFERTYKEIEKNKDNAVVYIGGDIAHSKTDMSPELVDQLSRLFKNLSDICPTIIIAGNHDCNLNNLSRLDVLTPIVNNLNHPNLHYLKDSGVYKCADVSFVVWDCWTKEEDFILADDVEGDTKVVLFHGTVDRAETDLGFHLPSDVHIDKFKGYDLGLLGDIHKRQFLDKEETIAYCGSLVQQNHGEGLSHGYLLWDVPKRKSKYVEVPNDYGYITLDIDGGELPIIDRMPKKARVRIRASNTKPSELKKCLAILHKKYGIKEIVVTRTDALYNTDRVRNDKITVGDISESDVQFNLIQEYLNNNHHVTDDVMLKIKNINESLNQSIPEEEIYRNVNWKLKTFEFENMFSYGENNKVDFRKLNGIVGIFAPNASGKSSLLDALSFCLFDTCTRAFRAENVLNNKKGDFSCKLNFEVDGQDYFIEKKAKKQRKGNVKVDIDFYTFDDSGEKVSMNGDQRRTTQVNIRKVIGTYDDFILTALSSQTDNSVFIEKTQKEKKTLLAQFMGLEIFDKLWSSANEEIREVSAILKNFKRNDWEKELSDIKTSKEEFEKKHDKLLEAQEVIDKTKQLQEDSVRELTRKLKSIDNAISNIDELEDERDTINEALTQIKIQHQQSQEKYDSRVGDKQDLQNKISFHNDNKTVDKYNDAIDIDKKGQSLKTDLENIKQEVNVKLEKIKKLGDLEYDEDCDYCMKNPFTLDAIETKKSIDNDKKKAKNGKKADKIDMLNAMNNNYEMAHGDKEDDDDDEDMEEAIEKRVQEVDVKEHVDALVNGEGDLSEEFKRKAATVFEAAVKSKIRDEVTRLEKEYSSELQENIEKTKGELTEKVDTYLNYVVEEWMKENELAIERGLKGEIAEDFISGLKTLFEDHYVDIPDEKYDVLEAQSEKITELEGKLNEAIEKTVSLRKNNGVLVREQVIQEATQDLADTEIEKFKSLTEDVEFTDEDSFRNKLETLKDNYFPKQQQVTETIDDVETGTAQDVDTTNSMRAYMSAIGKFGNSAK